MKDQGILRARAFSQLHASEQILILPGVWDVASARVFGAAGFSALGTTSTGICWSVGRTQGWDHFASATQRIVKSVEIPVTCDIESGFSDTPEGVQNHVRILIEAGASGINLEDGFVGQHLIDTNLHIEKLRAIDELRRDVGYPLFLNARTDVFLGGSNDIAEAVDRCQRYVDAGANCVFVPGISREADIMTLVDEVDAPVNIYAIPGVPSPKRLQDLGVRRISMGCGPQQSILAELRRIANALDMEADYTDFTSAWIPYEEAETLCAF